MVASRLTMSRSGFLPIGSEANQEGTQVDSVGYFSFRELLSSVSKSDS